MENGDLQLDHSCHVLYSKPCKAQIIHSIASHYPKSEHDEIWEKAQRQYLDFLTCFRKDLGGKKNFHNGAGGTYDCIALLSYYRVCKDKTTIKEIKQMNECVVLPSFQNFAS